jgi:hypothetical protein
VYGRGNDIEINAFLALNTAALVVAHKPGQ